MTFFSQHPFDQAPRSHTASIGVNHTDAGSSTPASCFAFAFTEVFLSGLEICSHIISISYQTTHSFCRVCVCVYSLLAYICMPIRVSSCSSLSSTHNSRHWLHFSALEKTGRIKIACFGPVDSRGVKPIRTTRKGNCSPGRTGIRNAHISNGRRKWQCSLNAIISKRLP
jgi:hypothetical protein